MDVLDKQGETASKIDRCRSCHDKHIETFFDLGEQALANSYAKSATEAEDSFPLQLSHCHNCGLVQLNHTVDPQRLFGRYFWVTGTSSTARNQSHVFFESAVAHLPNPSDMSYVVEIASNDGTFLRPFQDAGIGVLGVDPAENIVELANENGIETRCTFFGRMAADEIVAERGKPHLIIARNVLAHVADLHDFVDGISRLIHDDGVAAIEFHSGAKILQELQYDSIYHEHLCYFTGLSAAHLFKQFGLEIIDFGQSPISGGALILYLQKSNGGDRNSDLSRLDLERELGVDERQNWKKFAENAEIHKSKICEIVRTEVSAGRKIVGYGASARSSTMLNYCDLSSAEIEAIADQNDLKHGHFTAGTHIPIKSPDDVLGLKPDVVFILAWNFQDEILDVLKGEYGYTGRVIIPFPDPICISIE